MPKFIYAGTHSRTGASDGNEANSITMFGLTFIKGEPVEVTNGHAIHKLTGNAYFRIATEAAPELPVDAPEIGASLEPQPVNALMADAPAPMRRRRSRKED